MLMKAEGRCPTCWSPRSAADRTRSACSTRSSTMPSVSDDRRGGGRAHGIETGQHAASLDRRRAGHPARQQAPILLQDEDGQITEAHSISAGLDYPGIGPEHSMAARERPGRVYQPVTDIAGTRRLPAAAASTEGIIPALESSHAIAAVAKVARTMDRDQVILANLCGRGDNDIFTVAEALGTKIMKRKLGFVAFSGALFVTDIAAGIAIFHTWLRGTWLDGLGGGFEALALMSSSKLFARLWPAPKAGWAE